ncbi:CxxH/CxxC protein [Alkalihalobacillus sp. LMS39]|uniref:CxxH/CxxC protein n=1 Tax=Alkalihalobacillus sp. LMS39 TaxID=2924032 RepID=UPI001FB3B0A0|nr:CxxH/CxxC protein [Alkalihalobacillus sp. LMS39]UOE94111.1 CxxH/CxxC protein [Alkalihalobacillus sp. LMS39]
MMKFTTCLEHVEIAMEQIIDECEVAPTIEKIEELSTNCAFCNEDAMYIVSE